MGVAYDEPGWRESGIAVAWATRRIATRRRRPSEVANAIDSLHQRALRTCMRADALIFDLDGTLWDTNAICADAWNRVLTEMALERARVTEDDIRRVAGQPHRVAVEMVLGELDRELLDRFCERTMVEDNRAIAERGGELFDGVTREVPRLAEHWPLMIVSNCQSGYIEIFREHSRLDGCFVDHECWGNTRASKSENLRAIIERNDVKQPIFVGDTDGDWRAARDNDAVFVFASYGFGQVPDANATIRRFSELTEIVER